MSIEELVPNPTEDMYLVVDAFEPEADILFKKWRVRCRERDLPSFVIVRNGTEFIVEVGAEFSLRKSVQGDESY